MAKTTIILSHPEFENSIANKNIVDKIRSEYPSAEMRHLDVLYPDGNIDVESEQKILCETENIIFQFPFFWYSIPSLLKKYLDEVFTFNFAYGPEGDKLKDKNFLLSFTIGGPEEGYRANGYNHFTIDELLKPLEQTAYLSQMKWNKPIYTYWMVYIHGVYNTKNEVIKKAEEHSQRLLEFIREKESYSDEKLIKDFVKDWFSKMDYLEEAGYYIRHLYPDSKFNFPEGSFTGHTGFLELYKSLNDKYEPGMDYRVNNVKVTNSGTNEFEVEFLAELDAVDKSGEKDNLKVIENWKVDILDKSLVKIKEYDVKKA